MGVQKENKFVIEFERSINRKLEEWPGFRNYMVVSRAVLVKGFEDYCDGLNRIDCTTAREVIGYGIRFAEEKIQSYQTGNAEFVMAFASFIPDEIAVIDDPELQVLFVSAIDVEESHKFTHNPGVPSKETKKAHDIWWGLQAEKHRLAKDYLESKDKRDVAESDDKTKDTLAKKLANKVIENGKKYKNDPHTFKTIFYVMRYRLDHPDSSISALVKEIRGLKNCPSVLKNRPDKSTKPERGWINKVDDKLDGETANK